MKERCWVVVDRDGTEKISNSGFIRRCFVKSVMWGLIERIQATYTKNERNKWGNSWQWTSEGDNPLPFIGTVLPKGSIEKLTGKKMTWKDEPIEL